MKIQIKKNVCIASRELNDPIFRGTFEAKGESHLLFHIKKILNAKGYNLIKKRMWKDGHLVDDIQQYLRTRKPSGNPKKDICIYNSNFAIEGADETFKSKGKVYLSVIRHIFKY